MPYITVHVAPPGTPLTEPGGYSFPGHIYYERTHADGDTKSDGLAPAPEFHGSPDAPGDIWDNDNRNYSQNSYTRTVEISQAQFDKIQAFSKDPAAFGFDMKYNG